MPEIRASVTVEVHRKLKEEAARSGKHLKGIGSRNTDSAYKRRGRCERQGREKMRVNLFRRFPVITTEKINQILIIHE